MLRLLRNLGGATGIGRKDQDGEVRNVTSALWRVLRASLCYVRPTTVNMQFLPRPRLTCRTSNWEVPQPASTWDSPRSSASMQPVSQHYKTCSMGIALAHA